MKITEILTEAVENRWAEIVKKYKLKKGRPYYDSKSTQRWLCTVKGKTLFEINAERNKDTRKMVYSVYTDDRQNLDDCTDLSKLDEYLTKLWKKLEQKGKTTAVAMTDDKIVKWLGKSMAQPMSLTKLKNMKFISWKNGVQLVAAYGDEPNNYTIFIDGDDARDEESGLGEIGMSVKDFKEWLLKQGLKQAPRPKR